MKTLLSNAPVLRNFDYNLDVKIQTDSSKDGLGCVLLQQNQPVAFSSRSLTDAEKKLPQIEKETLAIAFACRKFHRYIWGKKVFVESDHLPLQTIFKKKLCEIASERITKIRLDLLRYDLEVTYLPGNKMFIADLLSRNFSSDVYPNEIKIEGYVHNIYSEQEVLDYELISEQSLLDNNLATVMKYTQEGWPHNKNHLPNKDIIRHYFKFKNELCVFNNVLFYNNRAVIPDSLKQKTLEALHSGHMGVTKTVLRAQQLFYWINLHKDVETFIGKCLTCQENRNSKTKEVLMPHEQSVLPFECLALDIATFKSKDYLVIIDQYSKWIEIFKLMSKKCSEIISKLKYLFSNHGIPKIIYSDGSPFNSLEIKNFCKEYKIDWRTSSPLYPQSNGIAERAVQIAKDILKKSDSLKIDYLELLLEYRATPLPALGRSPSEILMGRIIKTKIPVSSNNLKPIDNLDKLHQDIQSKMKTYRNKYSNYYNKTSRKTENKFEVQESVLLRDNNKWAKAKIIGKTRYPRSYDVLNEKGAVLRRNTQFLKHTSIEFTKSCSLVQSNGYDEIWDKKLIQSKVGDTVICRPDSGTSPEEVLHNGVGQLHNVADSPPLLKI